MTPHRPHCFLAQRAGARISADNIGKGGALSVARASKEPILFFFRRGYFRFTKNHLQNLINPILNNEADMTGPDSQMALGK